MQLEVTQQIVSALTHTSTGVIVQLAALPGVATTPANPLIVNAFEDDELFKGETIERGKDVVLLVAPDGPTVYSSAEIKGEYSLAVVPIAIVAVHRGSVRVSEKAIEVAWITRAVILAVAAYFRQDVSARTIHEITVLRTIDIQTGIVQDDGTGAVAAVTFRVQAFDKRAQRLF